MSLLVLGLSGCVSSTGSIGVNNAGVQPTQTTATQQAIGKCIVTIGGAALAGGILDKMLGGSGKTGALLGAAVGAETCVVLLMVAADEDQERVREIELAAIRSNQSSSRRLVTSKGETLTVTTKVTKAPIPDIPDTTRVSGHAGAKPKTGDAKPVSTALYSDCRYSTQTLEAPSGKSVTTDQQLWCLPVKTARDPRWTPMDDQDPGQTA